MWVILQLRQKTHLENNVHKFQALAGKACSCNQILANTAFKNDKLHT